MSCIDLAILLIYLVAVLAVGWHCRNTGNSREEHFLAGRSMKMLPIGISIMVTSFSAVNAVAIPEEVTGHGLYVAFSFPLFFIAAWPVARYWMPFFYKRKATTVYQFLEERYDCRVRKLASGVFLLWRFTWMAIALYASGKILAVFTGFSPVAICAVCGAIATAYTFIGGMKAVLWTDVMQFAVLMSGIILGLVAVLSSNSGLAPAVNAGRLTPVFPFDPEFLSPDPRIRMTLWSALFGVFTAFMTRYGADQVVMQRYFTARDLKQAQRGIWLNAAASVLALGLLALLGLAVYAHAVQTGAIAPGASTSKGFAMKHIAAMLKSAPPGLAGLVISGILAATMSSIDSGINACSAAIATDFRAKCSSKTLTLAIGIIITVLAMALLPGLNRHQSIFAMANKLINGMGSPLLAIVTLGMFTRFTTARGMFWGGLFGVIASIAVSLFVSQLALQYFAVVNALITFSFCSIGSLILKHNTETPTP